MSDYNAEEVEKAIAKAYTEYARSIPEDERESDDVDDEDYERYFSDWDELAYSMEERSWSSKPPLKTVKLRGEDVPLLIAEDHGGGEGEGEERWIVVKVGDQHFKKSGYYASYHGSEFDGDFVEVWPREQTIVVFGRERPLA